jgi:hypothetical protein
MANAVREHSRFRLAWDAGIITLILVSCTIIPFQLAFGIGPGGLGGAVVYAIDAVFVADIGLNLRTGYRHAGMVITEPRRAARHYLTTVFPFDVVASLPFDREVGREIYFIARGSVEVRSSDSAAAATVLERGDCFGHLSLILGERRSASARSRDFCDLFVLHHADFERIRSEYPEFREALKDVAADRTEKIASMLMDGIVI